MPKSFIVAPLDPARVDQAYPLIQAAHREMTPARWRTMAGDFLREGAAPRGIVACTMSDGHFRGLFCYAVPEDAPARRLAVPLFVAAGLFDVAATVDALCEAMERLARGFDCRSVAVDADGCALAALAPRLDPAGLFGARGYRADGRALVKEVGAEAERGFAVAGCA